MDEVFVIFGQYGEYIGNEAYADEDDAHANCPANDHVVRLTIVPSSKS